MGASTPQPQPEHPQRPSLQGRLTIHLAEGMSGSPQGWVGGWTPDPGQPGSLQDGVLTENQKTQGCALVRLFVLHRDELAALKLPGIYSRLGRAGVIRMAA